MSNEITNLLQRYSGAKSNAKNWRDHLEDAYDYAIPNRQAFNDKTPGRRTNIQVFDTTAVKAVIAFTSKLQSTLTPPGIKWAKLVAGKNVPKEFRPSINAQLEDVTRVMFDHLHESNFDLVNNEAFFDLAIGTAAILIQEGSDEDPLIFQSVPIQLFFPEEGPFGTIESVWRDYENILVRNVKFMWPKAVIPSSVQSQLVDNPDAKVNLIEGTVFNEKDKTYEYILLLTESNEIIFREKSDSSRWLVYRWSKRTNEIFGRGPVIEALPSIKTLNEIARFEMRQAQLSIAPPYMAYSDGVFNPFTVEIEPLTVYPVNRTASGSWPIQPIPVGGDVQFGQFLANDLRDQINKLLFADPLGPIDSPTKTATEITIRQQALLEEIGPSFGRLQVEFLNPLIKRVVFILRKKGLIPDLKIDGKEIDIEFQSPLSRTQGQSEILAFQQFFGIMQQTVGPELALAAIKAQKLPQWVAGKIGMDLNLVNSEEELAEIAQQAQEQMQAQQMGQIEGPQQAQTEVPVA